ncbi:MAG: histidine kinase [Chloroflexota bacterium]
MSAAATIPRGDAGRAPREVLRLLGPLVVLAGAMLLLPVGDVRPNTGQAAAFSALGGIPSVTFQLVGEALLVVGAVAWLVGLRARIGLLAVLAGIAWFGPDLAAQVGTDPLLRATGRFVVAPLLWPLLLHLGLAALGIDGRRPIALGLAVLYGATVAVDVATAATFAPGYDLWCTSHCLPANPFLVGSGVPGAIRFWRGVGTIVVGATAIAMVLLPLWWLWAIRDRSQGLLPVAAGMLLTGGAMVVRGVLMALDPGESLDAEPWRWGWALVCVAVLLLTLAIGGYAAREWRGRSRLRRFAETLDAAPAPGTLEAVLRTGLGDPGLRLGYWLDPGIVVDAAGLPWPAPMGFAASPIDAWSGSAGRTPIERDGVRLAVLDHSPSVDPGALAAAFTPTVLVALDNERLRAARLAQLRELRASRARIVAVGDAERRRLERDLHDGVQQQLLSLLFDVRLGRLAATRAGSEREAARLTRAEEHAQAAVDELRRIAHGIHPAVLTRSGLVAALASLAEEAPLPVDVVADGVGRLPEAVEAAAYQAVAETVAGAAADGAAGVTVEVTTDGRAVRLTIGRDGGGASASPEVPVRIADRVGAAGGEATAEALPTGGTLLRVELPCA